MQLQRSLPLTLLFATLTLTPALALPSLTPRQTTPDTYICEKAQWEGLCEFIPATTDRDPLGDCREIPFAKLSAWVSFGPDPGLMCAVYTQTSCMGEERMRIDFPGSQFFPAGDTQGSHLSFRCVDEMTIIPVDERGRGSPYSGPGVIENQF